MHATLQRDGLFEVPRKQSNRSVIFTSENPTAASSDTSSASGRAPAIQAVHKSMSRRASSETGRSNAAGVTLNRFKLQQRGGRWRRAVAEARQGNCPARLWACVAYQ